jgi:hypothetical protein
MNPLAKIWPGKDKPDADVLPLRGSRVPKFERGIYFAAARDATRIIAEVHQAPSELVEAWHDTADGRELRNILRRFTAHVSAAGME